MVLPNADLPRPFGEYTLLRRLAVGGMAEVYVASAVAVGGFERLVAIKVIHPRLSEDDHFVQMLIEEAKISVVLNHSNIAQCFDLGCIDDSYFIVMEYIDGADAYHMLRRATESGKPLPVDLCAFVAAEVLCALDYAHRKTDPEGRPMAIVHRDISPQNVLLSYSGEVKLVDFGIAKAAMRSQQTAAGIIKGKYYYMSPEQAWGDPVDSRSDIFSLGIVLSELLTGEMVYQEDNIPGLLDRVRKAEMPPLHSLRPELPAELVAIVERSLQKRPEHRYQTAHDMGQDLRSFLFSVSPSFSSQRLSDLMLELFPRPHEGEAHAAGAAAPAQEVLPENTGVPESSDQFAGDLNREPSRRTKELAPMSRDDFAPDVTKSVLFDAAALASLAKSDERTSSVTALPVGVLAASEPEDTDWGDHTLVDSNFLQAFPAGSPQDGSEKTVGTSMPPPLPKSATSEMKTPPRFTVPLDEALRLDSTDPATPRASKRTAESAVGSRAGNGRAPGVGTVPMLDDPELQPITSRPPEPTLPLQAFSGGSPAAEPTLDFEGSGPGRTVANDEDDRTQPRVFVSDDDAQLIAHPFPSPPSVHPADWAPPQEDPFEAAAMPLVDEPPPTWRRLIPRWMLAAVLGLAVFGAAGFLAYRLSQQSAPSPEVRIISSPAGARVFLDGRQLAGRTPLVATENLVAGRNYELLVELSGHRSWSTTLKPIPGVLERIAVLEPLQASLLVRSSPSGAALRVDGEPRGTTPVRVEGLPVGQSIEITLNHPEAGELREQVEITPDELEREIELLIAGQQGDDAHPDG